MNEKKKLNPWPIVITIICVSAFAAAATIVYVMVQKRVELVRPDYYAQDLLHEKRMDQERNVRALKSPAVIDYDTEAAAITIDFPSTNVMGHITLYRPSDLSLDREIVIDVSEGPRQLVDTAGLTSGLWRVRIEWFQGEQGYYQEKSVTLP